MRESILRGLLVCSVIAKASTALGQAPPPDAIEDVPEEVEGDQEPRPESKPEAGEAPAELGQAPLSDAAESDAAESDAAESDVPENDVPETGSNPSSGAVSSDPTKEATAGESASDSENSSVQVEAGENSASAAGWGDLGDLAEVDDTPLFQTRLYGFINAYVEKVAKTPARDGNGDTIYETNPYEWDVLNFNIMLQGSVASRYKYFFNLVGNGAGSNTDDVSLDVRNAWVELPIIAQYLNVRAGKTYRRFGLYNEILDAVPTFIGIEPPELFDQDHLMLTRTTNLMLHGAVTTETLAVNYSATTGNDERSKDTLPLGADLNLDLSGFLKVGSSFYYSGPAAAPSRAVGDGSPRGGVANWMARDEYFVVGAYIEARIQALLIQAAFWNAHHNAERDPDQVALLADADLNERQLERFFEDGDPTGDVNVDAVYDVRTFYSRIGYEIVLGKNAAITPYAQFDYFENPETIRDKDFGGDNEAGLADDGKFFKYTLGAVFRPIPQVALKLDASAHQQEFNGKTEIYPEGRCSLSYLWEL